MAYFIPKMKKPLRDSGVDRFLFYLIFFGLVVLVSVSQKYLFDLDGHTDTFIGCGGGAGGLNVTAAVSLPDRWRVMENSR